MSLIKDIKVVDKIICLIKSYYENTFYEKFDDVDIYVTDNINNDTILFAEIDIESLSSKCNGRYIQPNKLSPNATILININTFKAQNYSFVATILHELTHACDYKKFVNDYCNNNWEELINHPNEETFFMVDRVSCSYIIYSTYALFIIYNISK